VLRVMTNRVLGRSGKRDLQVRGGRGKSPVRPERPVLGRKNREPDTRATKKKHILRKERYRSKLSRQRTDIGGEKEVERNTMNGKKASFVG